MIDSVQISGSNGTQPEPQWFHSFRDALRAPWTPFALAVIFVTLDFFSGPLIQFPVTFVISVALAAWYGTLRSAAFLAVAQPALNVLIAIVVKGAFLIVPVSILALNAGIRAVVLLILAYFIHRSAMQSRVLARRVGLLRDEIPVCFECKKIQDESADWTPFDVYISRHTGARFTNSLCPSCKESIVDSSEKQ